MTSSEFSTPDRLTVWSEGTLVGELWVEQGTWHFRYAPSWNASPERFAISPNLPLTDIVIQDRTEDRQVEWFFENLLPEGGVREALARYVHLEPDDVFGLLARFGEESAGALTLLPPGAEYPSEKGYDELSRDQLREWIAERPQLPFITAGGSARMSLAGAQHKLAVHRRGSDFLLPRGGASSAIIKPDNGRPEQFPFCPANEHFCMSLAREVGLTVPRSEIQHIPEPIYIVDRFDRFVVDDVVRRCHQIDLCQLLGKWPKYKYESDGGGVTFSASYLALDSTRQPAVSRKRLLDWLMFNYVIGNSDAHAKNISFLVGRGGIDLAPAYDLLCVAAYGMDYDYMAMTIGGEVRHGWVEQAQWNSLAQDLGLAPGFLATQRKQFATTVPVAARAVLAREPFTDDERTFLGKVLAVIDLHAGYVLASV